MLKATRDAPQTTRALAAASVSTLLELRPGHVLASKYLLIRPLGAGGMGQVWVAQNLNTHAEVAVKLVLPERAVSGDSLERFRREAQATASMSHRGIVRAFDLVELDAERGSLLMVMELLRGQTLAQRLEQVGRLTIVETVQVMVPILSALEHAHRVGLVHRDLKPDNVFLAEDPDGEVIPKLVDFGISKMRHLSSAITARGALVGTPAYMSPEQARAEAVDGRSDVFAVGILLHECLSGASPFDGETLADIVRAVLEVEPPPIEGLPYALRDVVARALAKRPEDRYPTAAALAQALLGAVPEAAASLRSTPAPSSELVSLSTLPPAVAHPTVAPRAPSAPRRTFFAWAAIGVSVLALAVTSQRRSFDDRATAAARPPSAERAPHALKRLTVGRDAVVAPSDDSPPAAPETTRRHGAKAAPAHAAAVRASRPADPASPATAPSSTLVRDPGF